MFYTVRFSLVSCLVIMFCESIILLTALGVAQINQDALVKWNNLCQNDRYVKNCVDDRVYIFAAHTKQMSFIEAGKLCRSLAPCDGLGNLVSIDNCEQLELIVNLTTKFISDYQISTPELQVWTLKLKELEEESNLLNNCQHKANFDPKRLVDSDYSIMEIDTPRISVRNTDKSSKHTKATRKKQQHGYVLCEIFKPTKYSACIKVAENYGNGNKTVEAACKSYLDKKRKSTPPSQPTEIPEIEKKHFDWTNIDDMIEEGKNYTHILKNVDDKIDQLMTNNGTILDLLNIFHRLDTKFVPVDFEKNKKEITTRYTKILSSALNPKYKSAWTAISYKERKNASMQIIKQMNNVVKDTFCFIKKDEEFDLNPNSQSKNKNVLRTENILLEAFNLGANKSLNKHFSFPGNSNPNTGQFFGENLIFFPYGLNFTEIDLFNPGINCSSFNIIKRNFAAGVVYKNLAEYLHNNRLDKTLSVEKIERSPANDGISYQSMEDEFEFKEGERVTSTEYSVRSRGDVSDDNNEKSSPYEDHLLNSHLVGLTFNNIITKSIKLNSPARILIGHLQPKERLDQVKCVFFNFTTEEWSEDGCRIIGSSRFHSVCECDHLTNFAALMDVSGREQTDDSVKSALTLLFSILSIIGLLIVIITFTFIPKLKSKRNLITAHLCFNLLLVNILVAFFLEIKTPVACQIISIFLFYFLINSFCWMLIQGYFLYQMIVLVFSNVGYFRLKHMILYSNGFSLVWTLIVLSIIGPQGFYNDKYSYFCWLSEPNNLQNLWYFMGPVFLIIICNLGIIVISFKETYQANRRRIKLSHIPKPILRSEANSYLEFGSKSMKSSKASSTTTVDNEVSASKVKSWFRGWITLMLLLGLTWVIGFLMIFDVYQIASYTFILLNSLQGFYIFLFEIVLNVKCRSTIVKLIRDKLVVRYLIITSKENQLSTKTVSSSISPISSGLTHLNDSGEEISSGVYVNRINKLDCLDDEFNNNNNNNNKAKF